MTFIRILDKADPIQYVHIFAPLLREVPKSPELLESLNEINLGLLFCRVVWAPSEEIVMGMDLPAITLNDEQVLWATDFALGAADYFDTLISKRYGGRKWFEDEAPSINV